MQVGGIWHRMNSAASLILFTLIEQPNEVKDTTYTCKGKGKGLESSI